MTKVYNEIVEFIAMGSTSQQVVHWQPSDESKRRVAELVAKERADLLSVDEQSELTHYLELEHLMRLAKARARLQTANG